MDNKSNLEKLNSIMWQSLYYANLCSWLPLSSMNLNDTQLEISDLKSLLNKTEQEVLFLLVEKNVQLLSSVKTYELVRFIQKITEYVIMKEHDFETAFEKAKKLKSFSGVYFRKSELTLIVKTTINSYKVIIDERNTLKNQYTSITTRQLDELTYLLNELKNGEKELTMSSGLFTTLLYKQGLSYIPDLDKLLTDQNKQEAIQQMKQILNFIEEKEMKLWSEDYVTEI